MCLHAPTSQLITADSHGAGLPVRCGGRRRNGLPAREVDGQGTADGGAALLRVRIRRRGGAGTQRWVLSWGAAAAAAACSGRQVLTLRCPGGVTQRREWVDHLRARLVRPQDIGKLKEAYL